MDICHFEKSQRSKLISLDLDAVDVTDTIKRCPVVVSRMRGISSW